MALVLTLPTLSGALGASSGTLDSAVSTAAAYMLRTVAKPEVGSVGGEWAVLGLARSGYAVPSGYYESYYRTVETYVRERDGVLHAVKYTEYSRLILALTAAGFDPRNVAGYDLTKPLGDFEKTVWQGINGPVFALIALDSGNYAIPRNADAKTQATRDLYIAEILRRQLPDGGFNLTAGANGVIGTNERADPDITGMTIQALAKYQSKPEVKAATDRALVRLSEMQDSDGGYTSWGSVNSESVVQVIVALTEFGIPLGDARFVKNGKTLLDNLLSFRNADGSFRHTAEGAGNNQMSAEQGLYAVVAAQRARDGKNSLYRMGDAVKRSTAGSGQTTVGLPNKNAAVNAVPVNSAGKTFADIKNHANRSAIETLAARGIISGITNTEFKPDQTMTRAEFAAIITRGLGLTARANAAFTDVKASSWYAGFVGTAYTYGIIQGVGGGRFNPEGMITRQEAAVMVARAAKLCGLDTAMSATATRDELAQFGDYRTVASWAQAELAFCYAQGILDSSALNIEPTKNIRRGEIAEMLYRTLKKSELLK
jgi:hypothetical protein